MKILLLETIHPEAVSLLSNVGRVELIESLDPAHVIDRFVDAAAVITRGRGRMPREALMAGKNLKCVARCGAGTDNIDVATATELRLPVLFSPEGTTFSVAEHALMLLLAVSRKVTFLDRQVRDGRWEVRNNIGLNSELNGKTLGILGFGRIGKRIAELGQAFGMRIIYWSRKTRDERFTYVGIEELFQQSDALSISLSLNAETRGIVDARLISLMKPSAILINTARGEMIDESALCDALASGRLAGAGIDVMSVEPPSPEHPLLKLDNIIITPHVAVLTDVTYRNMCLEVAQQVAGILQGRSPDKRNVRNPETL